MWCGWIHAEKKPLPQNSLSFTKAWNPAIRRSLIWLQIFFLFLNNPLQSFICLWTGLDNRFWLKGKYGHSTELVQREPGLILGCAWGLEEGRVGAERLKEIYHSSISRECHCPTVSVCSVVHLFILHLLCKLCSPRKNDFLLYFSSKIGYFMLIWVLKLTKCIDFV